MIEAGRVLQDRYRVERQIGQGGMGAVYIATDQRFGSTVAIKETLFLDEKFRKAFEREAKLLNGLRHPALPRVSDHFIDGNGQFLVMEYIEGEDLSEMMEHEGRVFPLADVLNWADQLLDALEYLHGQEMPVIHRDIKPQNLKLTPRGQIILLDFGLAKGHITNADSATAAKSVFGYSKNYASLEQIQGTGTDPRSDLYSLAATLYHLMTGVPPADALTRAMNVLSDKEDPLIEAAMIRPEIPLAVSRVLTNVMALNAAQRPATAVEMRGLLKEASREGATPLPPVTNPDRRLATSAFSNQTTGGTPGVQAGIATEVLGAPDSEETRLRPQNVTDGFTESATRIHPETVVTNAGRSKRKAVVAGAVLSALALAGGASAVYVYRADIFKVQPAILADQPQVAPPAQSASNVEPNVPVDAEENPASNTSENSVAADSAPESPSKSTVTKQETKQPGSKQPDPARPETRVEAGPGPQGHPVPGQIPPDGMPPIPPDRFPPPRDPETGERIPEAVWQKLTPLQRRQLREAVELNRRLQEQERRRQIVRPTPVPVPTRNQ